MQRVRQKTSMTHASAGMPAADQIHSLQQHLFQAARYLCEGLARCIPAERSMLRHDDELHEGGEGHACRTGAWAVVRPQAIWRGSRSGGGGGGLSI